MSARENVSELQKEINKNPANKSKEIHRQSRVNLIDRSKAFIFRKKLSSEKTSNDNKGMMLVGLIFIEETVT